MGFDLGLVVSTLFVAFVVITFFCEVAATAFMGAVFLLVWALTAADKNNTVTNGKMYFFMIVFLI